MVNAEIIKNAVSSVGSKSILELKRCNWNLKKMDFKYSKDTVELHMAPKKEKLVPINNVLSFGGNSAITRLYSYFKIIFKNKGIEPLKRNVDSEKELYEYAQSRVVPRLKAPIPHEYEVVSDGKNILREFAGNETNTQPLSAYTVNLLVPGAKLTTFHGHPNIKGSNKTFPISLEDFISMSGFQGQHKCVALNANGEYSSLTKLPEFKPLESQQIKELTDEYETNMCDNLPDEIQKTLTQVRNEYNAAKNEKIKQSLNNKGLKLINDFLMSESGIPLIHNFWKENAQKLGVKYETNYSYLQK